MPSAVTRLHGVLLSSLFSVLRTVGANPQGPVAEVTIAGAMLLAAVIQLLHIVIVMVARALSRQLAPLKAAWTAAVIWLLLV